MKGNIEGEAILGSRGCVANADRLCGSRTRNRVMIFSVRVHEGGGRMGIHIGDLTVAISLMAHGLTMCEWKQSFGEVRGATAIMLWLRHASGQSLEL